ncbi:polysaccharide deacetylase family protein [Reichenbachiella agarivorans]|uniref:Polysaccharide deacetylase family protein n=1 Tax=Reichenbachiella agarivorans TaxID=2979464 RepID=A0ABY6CK15_9BACT|nr:polysaccharide deacetylase family protein [Reichenbachiella agarivorans]UXP30851.1 polysaccharide deacetylase family protein [Reichenbachiella agarivorans]
MSSFYFKRIPHVFRVLFPSVIWSGDKGKQTLYLTFDDGPSTHSTTQLLDILSEREVSATFFLSGSEVDHNPDLVQKIIDNNHQIANHAYHHVHGKSLGVNQFVDAVDCTQELIKQYVPVSPKLFRPPYGELSFRQYRAIRSAGYKVVMWSLMPGDFDTYITDQECLDILTRHTKAGDIIVLHDNEKCIERLKLILPQYLEYCLSRGYRFELLK